MIDGQTIKKFDQSPAEFANDELQKVIDLLYEDSDICAYATFGAAASQEVGAVLLCGFGERFRTISIFRHLRIACLIVQDPRAPWFTGSAICSGLTQIKDVMSTEFPNVRRWLLVGQSSGAYGALYLSRIVPANIAIAFAPQTCDDSLLKQQKIFFPPRFAPSSTRLATHPFPDLRDIFFNGKDSSPSSAYIISAYSEHENPPTAWLWLDAMHWGRLVEHPDVTVFITNFTSHAILYKNASKFAELMRDVAAAPWHRAAVSGLISKTLYAE